MINPGALFSLPLLTKDLIEQAAMKRTYVLRILYAVILYGLALWYYWDIAGSGSYTGTMNLGRGRELFQVLMVTQMSAIILLLPAISCGAITAEKERDTLGLLLLTQLRPMTIVLEKLFSRLVTMGTYQLLSLPLFAVVYGLGGVELFEIVAAIWYLAWWSVVVGSLSIACSAWHRTTAGAFVAAYALMPLVVCMATSCLGAMTPVSNEIWHSSSREMSWSEHLAAVAATIIMLLVTAFPMFILSLVALSFAQIQLLARAFVPPRNIMLEVFRSLDKFFESLNSWTTRGVVLARDFDTGPMFEPIAWRETRKRSLGTVRYLFRLLVVLEVPLAIAIIWTLADNTVSSFNGPTIFFLGLLWPIAALAVTVHATNVMISERSRQTLDVLLVTPISARELISQKLAGVRRLIGVLSVPFLTLLIFQTIWSFYVVSGLDHFRNANLEFIVFLHEVLAMAFALVVYPRILQWMAFLMALVMKNQTQAVLTSLAIIIALCVGPFLLLQLTSFLMPYLGPPDESPLHWIAWLSPVRSLFHREFSHNYTRFSGYYPPTGGTNVLSEDWWFIGLIGHMVIYLTLWLVLRLVALRSFSTCVGRAESVGGTA